MDVRQALGDVSADTIRLCELRARLDRWAASGEQLSQWVAYRDRAEHATALGCGDVVERLADGRQMPESVIPAFEITYYEAIYADMVRAEPELTPSSWSEPNPNSACLTARSTVVLRVISPRWIGKGPQICRAACRERVWQYV